MGAVVFCNIAWMKNYRGITDEDQPYNGGSFVKENDVADLANHIYRWVTVSNNARQSIRVQSRNEILAKWSVDYQISLLRNVLT